MKRQLTIITFLFLFFSKNSVYSQNEKSPYLFNEFKEALVYYKDSRVFKVPMNYNLVIGQFQFIDKKDGDKVKEFSEPEMVVSIKIEDKTYLPTEGGATEVLQFDPEIYVQYKGTTKTGGKDLPYGGRSETASVENYSRLYGTGTSNQLNTESVILTSVYKVYHIKIKKSKKSFSSEKQFLKIFKKQKEEIKQYIEEKQVDFNSIPQVIGLCNYAYSLSMNE